MKSLIFDTFANCYVWLGAIAAWQEDFAQWIKVIAGVSAITLTWVTIYFKVKKNGQDK